MCGILCLISESLKAFTNQNAKILDSKLNGLLQNRGPDACKAHKIADKILFIGSVLWQQGRSMCVQPLEDNHICLLFNGDIFGTGGRGSFDGVSDTEWLAKAISKCSNDAELIDLFSNLKGPYSLIYYDRNSECLYFLRDSLGRNSLILEVNNSDVKISSTSYNQESNPSSTIVELPPIGLYKLNIRNIHELVIFPWKPSINDIWSETLKQLNNHFHVNINFDRIINPIWLGNTKESKQTFDFYELYHEIKTEESSEEIFSDLLANDAVNLEIEHFDSLLEKSLKDRITKTPPHCQNCIKHRLACNHSKVAILFSGGIDCSILTILADKFVPKSDSIDLINVAFENVKGGNTPPPDRISAKESLMEIEMLCPSRKWNFIEVNVSRQELHDAMHNHVRHLIFPLETVLDESLGAAFWFAARGMGTCHDEKHTSPARIVLLGSGADELFGGYIRHRNAFRRCQEGLDAKLKCVEDELEKDFEALPARNLARDDRVIGDTGRTKRTPFIEEDLVEYVRNLRGSQRSCYLFEEGIGDKLFLRLCGFKLGLRKPALFKKRAIQFGSRIANKKQNAKDVSEYLRH